MSITKETNGTYTVQCRVRDWTGKVVHKKKRGFIKKKDAKNWETQMIKEGQQIDFTMSEFLQVYFEDKKSELKPRTLENKKHVFNKHILPYFGNVKMSDIEPKDLIQWQNTLCEMDYSETYLHDIQKHLSALFTHATKVYKLDDNPCKRIRQMGKSDADKFEFWTVDEYNKFIETFEVGTKYYVIFETLFWTGMRIGELLALTVEDVDFRNNRIHINKTYYRKYGIDHITPPKTEQSVRTIEAADFLIKELKEYVSKLYITNKQDRIFPMVAESVQRQMKRNIEKYGLKKIRVHDLRHSHAAYLIDHGIEAIMIRDRLGHKDIRVTLNTYGHLYPNRQKELAEMMNREKGEYNCQNK